MSLLANANREAARLLKLAKSNSGRTECMISMMSQCIKNNEGVFYCNGASDVSVYSKMFAFSNQYNRIDDLFVLNFVISPQNKEKISHTIDPINRSFKSDQT